MTMRFRYTHYRVPLILDRAYPKRGSPSKYEVEKYSRKLGWDGVGLKGKSTPPHSRGGKTLCEIVDKDDNVLNKGVAVCSYADNFSYRLGRIIARGRALDQIHSGKPSKEIQDD